MKSLLPLSLFTIVLLIRLLNSLTIQTYFQPDEFYQSLEPAHHFVFGYGYITWEWREQLRSSIHPLIYAAGYKLVQALHSKNEVELVLLAPKIIGAIIAAIGEYNLYKFAQIHTKDETTARATLLLSLFNPFNWYFTTRSFSNSFETVLIIIGLRFWAWLPRIDYKKFTISITFGIISCIVRPTNAMLWGYLGIHLLLRVKVAKKLRILTIMVTALITLLAANAVLDFFFYKQVTFPIYNFIEFNVVRNLSIFYGTAPWHFYVVQAVPILLMTYLPFLFHSLIWLRNYQDPLVQAGLFVLTGFSVIAHKEFRFIYPLQPIFMVMCAYSIKKLYKRLKWGLIGITVINVMIAYFFTRVNERGIIDLMKILRKEDVSFGFIGPCHSTPWQSHLHNEKLDSSWFLTCEPPLHLANSKNIRQYRDESDQFYDNPEAFLKGKQLPEKLVVFESLEPLMEKIPSYTQSHRLFNSYFHWDGRREGDLIIYSRPSIEK